MTTVWQNWAGSVEAQLARVVSPADTQGVVDAVQAAARDGLTVKAVGSGHSFSPIAETDGVQVRLDRMNRLIAIDQSTGLATVQAGAPLYELNPLLQARGWAMENLGDIDRQTISGATSTGTHGTGIKLGGISTQIRALEMVLADGSVVRCSADERPELFAAARVGIGALGIITELTLQCVPSFVMAALDEPLPLGAVIDDIDDLIDGNDHFEFFWFPHTETALTRRNTRLPTNSELHPMTHLRRWFDDRFVTNVMFEALLRVGTRAPATVPRITKVVSGSLTRREYADHWHNVLTSDRNVRFREGEYAIPRASIADALKEIRRWIRSSGERISFPLEVRFAAPDDIWLSTAYQRQTAYVAFHQYHRMPHERLFQAMEDILNSFDGRPHWGKMHRLGTTTLRRRYPHLDDFIALRDELDPGRRFANTYLRRVIGP